MNRSEARKRAKALVARMTLEEKAGQMRYDAPAIDRLGIPAYNWWNEALHGVARSGQATVFPQAIGLGATFDPELVREIADVIGTEGRARYNIQSSSGDRGIYKGLTFWSPNVNIFRDPRWGRGQETYGEDPYLTSALGTAFVKGLQGDGETMKAAACAKHFAAHSGPERLRHEFDARVSKKDLSETYLPAFQALVEDAGVEAVMGAYNRTNGEPCCASGSLQRILREEWGFQGHFVSDCWAIRDFHEHHMVTATAAESAALAANHGCDLNCGNTYLHILKAYQMGLVSEETITESVIRLFTTRFLLGLFDGSEYDRIPYTVVECEKHLQLAERAAEESFVLLKNNGLLPLRKEELKTVGIIGPNADSRRALVGNYHGTASRYVTIQEGIQDYLGSRVRVLTSEGCDLFRDKRESQAQAGDRLSEARAVAMNSDVVILCVGLDETLEGEEGDTGNSYASGDKADLLLPGSQRDLMDVIAETGKPVVFVQMTGSDVDLSYAAEHFDAILQIWYPGAQGGRAAARVIFGDASPSGKLPVTFYESIEELPPFEDYSMEGRTYRYMKGEAQYPFGFGLTYGDARVKSARILTACAAEAEEEQASEAGNEQIAAEAGNEQIAAEAGDEQITVEAGDGQIATETGTEKPRKRFIVEAEVENMGAMATRDVFQIYVKSLDSALAPRNPSLCAFMGVRLEPGEKQTVRLDIPGRAFTVVDQDGKRMIGGRRFVFYAGFSQPDEKSRKLMGASPAELYCEI